VPGTDPSVSASNPLLIVISGPTAVGKTELCASLAKSLGCEIISADSRQFYRELKIGTASPPLQILQEIRHHFIGHLSIRDPYNAYRFEEEALCLLDNLFKQQDVVILTGGSGLYLHAVCHGIDELPDPDPGIRATLTGMLDKEGIPALQRMLEELDPVYYKKVDKQNPVRMIRAIEVCLCLGSPYSDLLKYRQKPRNFRILKIGLNRERQELIQRIELRTDEMIRLGFVEEARELIAFADLGPLNTVGYKELFGWMKGETSYEQAVQQIKTNTRRYAKRQLTWLRRDKDFHWFHADDIAGISSLITATRRG